MPQITLEHSTHFDATDWRALALEIHRLCVETVGATLPACKTRIVRCDRLIIADGDPDQAMVHCDLRILSGRTQEQKTALVSHKHCACFLQCSAPRSRHTVRKTDCACLPRRMHCPQA